MTAIAYFRDVWERCDHLSAVHAFVASNSTGAIKPDEILRAEWVARVSALDLYVHELVTVKMLDIFLGTRPTTNAFSKFKLTSETMQRIKRAKSESEQTSAFELEVRQQFSILTFQDPEKIADAIRLISDVELWNEIAIKLGATSANRSDVAKQHKKTLSLIVNRRNKIAHEGDLQPLVPRVVWPIDKKDVKDTSDFIWGVVHAIDAIIN